MTDAPVRPGLPAVLVPVLNDASGLDACLASLERTLPSGSRVLIADDASGDPRIEPLACGWCQRSKLSATYTRRPQRNGFARNCILALAELEPDDVVLLAADAVVTSGWLEQLAHCARQAPRAASITCWTNAPELASFPLTSELNAVPEFPDVVAEAAARINWDAPPLLPAAAQACLFLRRDAFRQIGGFDGETFAGRHVLDDLSRRAAAMGWSNLLCTSAFIIRPASLDSAGEADGRELDRLLARWPDYQEQVARFILADPLRPLRQRLQERMIEIARSGPQRDLFN